MLISCTLAFEPVGGQTSESVTHGQCDARPTVTFPAAEHHRPLAGTKLYCLVTETHGCEQLARSCYPAMHRPGVEPATSRLQVQRPTTTPPSVKTTVLIFTSIKPVKVYHLQNDYVRFYRYDFLLCQILPTILVQISLIGLPVHVIDHNTSWS